MRPKPAEYSTQQVMRTIRSGSVPMLMQALDYVQDGMVDADRNTPLHTLLLNPSVNSSAKLLEALTAEFIGAGVNPLAQNKDGQTPRQLAEVMVSAQNISDGQYGALNTIIMRLGEVEKQLQPEKHMRSSLDKAAALSQNESWVQTVLQGRKQQQTAAMR